MPPAGQLALPASWPCLGPVVSKLRVFSTRSNRRLYEEIDYINEGQNAETFAESLVGTGANVVVPKVFKNVTTEKVLTMEYIESIKMTDKAKVR